MKKLTFVLIITLILAGCAPSGFAGQKFENANAMIEFMQAVPFGCVEYEIEDDDKVTCTDFDNNFMVIDLWTGPQAEADMEAERLTYQNEGATWDDCMAGWKDNRILVGPNWMIETDHPYIFEQMQLEMGGVEMPTNEYLCEGLS